jgi:hypothetical protein
MAAGWTWKYNRETSFMPNLRSTLASVLAVAVTGTLAFCPGAEPPIGKVHSRTLTIGGTGRQPKFTLDVSAEGRTGIVVVKNSVGVQVQRLSCDLFREWGSDIGVDAATTARVIDYHDESFVSGLKTTDLDFDGLPDILAVRDFGAKWAKYCVWLYDPGSGTFVEDALSRQMEDLVNLTVDTEHRSIVSFTIGPTSPMRDEYRIDARSAIQHAERRLLPVRSCVLDTGATAGADRTATVVKYVDGREVVQRRTVLEGCNDVCGDGCPSALGKDSQRH